LIRDGAGRGLKLTCPFASFGNFTRQMAVRLII
jgi:hypothetical protein